MRLTWQHSSSGDTWWPLLRSLSVGKCRQRSARVGESSTTHPASATQNLPRPRPSTCFSRPRRAPPFSTCGEQAANVLGRNLRLDMAQRVKTMQPRGEHRVACVLSRLGSISGFVSGLQRRRVLQRPRDAYMRMVSSFRRNASRRWSKGRGPTSLQLGALQREAREEWDVMQPRETCEQGRQLCSDVPRPNTPNKTHSVVCPLHVPSSSILILHGGQNAMPTVVPIVRKCRRKQASTRDKL